MCKYYCATCRFCVTVLSVFCYRNTLCDCSIHILLQKNFVLLFYPHFVTETLCVAVLAIFCYSNTLCDCSINILLEKHFMWLFYQYFARETLCVSVLFLFCYRNTLRDCSIHILLQKHFVWLFYPYFANKHFVWLFFHILLQKHFVWLFYPLFFLQKHLSVCVTVLSILFYRNTLLLWIWVPQGTAMLVHDVIWTLLPHMLSSVMSKTQTDRDSNLWRLVSLKWYSEDIYFKK